MRVSQEYTAVFGEPNLVSCAGLAPVLTLAERAGLPELLDQRMTMRGPGTANGGVKLTALVAGMVAGADSIDDMDVLRHGATGQLFGGVRASVDAGHVREHVHLRSCSAARRGRRPHACGAGGRTPLLAGAAQIAYVGIDDTVKRTYGYAKQDAGYGCSGVKALTALLATVSTPLAAPVIARFRAAQGYHKQRPRRLARPGW